MNALEKILREALAEDKSLLSRRDELLAALEKKVPSTLRRDFTSIKKAISLNVGEKFLVGEQDKEATKKCRGDFESRRYASRTDRFCR